MNRNIIEYRVGDSFERVYQWRNSDIPVELTAIVATFQVTVSPYIDSIIEKECTVDAEKGDVYVFLTGEETALLKAGAYFCRVQLLYPNNKVQSTDWLKMIAKRFE